MYLEKPEENAFCVWAGSFGFLHIHSSAVVQKLTTLKQQ